MSASAPPPQGLLLPEATIEQLHEAAVTAGLAPRRQTLLAGIDPAFVTSLDDDAPNPASRLVSDLHALNRVKELTDGTVPLAIWLSNAKRIAKSRVEAEVFRRALEEITPQAGKRPAPQPPQQRSSAMLVAMAFAGVALAAALLYAFLPPSPPPTSAKVDPPPATAPPQSSSVTSAPTAPAVPTTTIPLSPAAKPSAKAGAANTAASAPSAPSAPPSASPPSGARSGTATCASATSCTLGRAPLDPSLARVCLDAPASAADLAGHIPVCTISAGNVCFISRPPLTKPLLSPVTWRPCSP